MTKQFPKDFVFGAATAAFQAEGAVKEGGRGPCYWDEYLHRPESTFTGDHASGFYHKFKEDLAHAKEFGLNGIRISIAWTRVIPDGDGEVNQAGLDFYHELIDECWKNGIEPYVTLHHFDTPLPLHKNGDWLDRKNIKNFKRFANVCFEEFGSKVNKWITINEPWSLVAGQYIIGHFPPNTHYSIKDAVEAMHNMMVAHSEAVKSFKESGVSGEIGIVHILESKYPITESEGDREAAKREDVLANQFMLDANFKGAYTEDTFSHINKILNVSGDSFEPSVEDMELISEASTMNDFIGVNYYASHFIAAHEGESEIVHNGTGKKGSSVFALKGIGKRVDNPDIPKTDWDWPIFPKGLYDMIMRLHTDYPAHKKIYVTENGLGYKDDFNGGNIQDDARIDYVSQHLNAILEAVEAGADVRGYFLWSLMDVLSWTNGFNKRYGFLYVDFDTQDRYVKKSGRWMKKVTEQNQLVSADGIEY